MILCAALLVEIKETGVQTVVPCLRHGDGFHLLRLIGKDKFKVVEQGFIDTKNNFYTRAGAFNICKENGQLNATVLHFKEDKSEEELYSEDLY